MSDILVLDEAEIRRLVDLEIDVIDAIERAFRALADGVVVMPPILHMEIADRNAEVDVKTAYLPGLDGFAIKVSPGFFDNPSRGLPSTSGLMIVHSAETGRVRAVLLDNGYLTNVRTAAAGAVAARHLSRPDASVAGIIGGGAQGRWQARALALVRPIERVILFDLDAAQADAAVAEIRATIGCEAEVATSPEAVVRACDVLVTTTPARQPHVKADWLHPGLHITAMGSDAPYKNELEPAVLVQADLFVCDRRSQSAALGELHHAIEAGVVPADWPVAELGDIVTGRHAGRLRDDDVTVCDLTGTGAQDTAIADHTLRVASI
jgi:ornithine cyclodeaminase